MENLNYPQAPYEIPSKEVESLVCPILGTCGRSWVLLKDTNDEVKCLWFVDTGKTDHDINPPQWIRFRHEKKLSYVTISKKTKEINSMQEIGVEFWNN